MLKQFTRLLKRHPSKAKFNNRCSSFALPNVNLKYLPLAPDRRLHLSCCNEVKSFIEKENSFAYNILQTFPDTKINTEQINLPDVILCDDDFNRCLDQNWRFAPANEIVETFEKVLNYCVNNNVNVSDDRFNKLVDGLMDNVEKLTTKELAILLNCLVKYPPPETFKSHNYHDIWSALDDACCWRISEWDLETMLMFADMWYKLNLGRICDYINTVLEKLSRKPERLTKDQLVRVFFYINVRRKRSVDFEYESAVERKVHEMTCDELAIIAMGFFKTKSKVKLPQILATMMTQVKKESDSVHEISLTAILKVIRFSTPVHLSDQMIDFLEHLTPQIDRLSTLCCLHIALLGTGVQVYHEKSLAAVSQKIMKYVHDVNFIRLKDIERLLLAFTMFDFDPQTKPNVFQLMHKELLVPERLPEKLRYPRCLPCALSYLSIRNIYSYELMNEVLDPEFIAQTYGKNIKHLPRELFTLDLCTEIECPDYVGRRVDPKMRYKAAKWLTEFTPSYEQYKKLSAADKLILDVVDTVNYITGDKKYSFIGHLLPHFSKSDIILCVDKKTKQFVLPMGFENYTLGDVMRPCNTEDVKWYAVVTVGWNMTVRNTSKTLGVINMKSRQLRTIGYEPVLVIWNEYLPLQKEEKIDYVLSKIRQV